jgi:hypothetical protein
MGAAWDELARLARPFSFSPASAADRAEQGRTPLVLSAHIVSFGEIPTNCEIKFTLLQFRNTVLSTGHRKGRCQTETLSIKRRTGYGAKQN